MCASFTYSKKLLPVIAICLSLSTLISKCAQTFIRIMQFVRAQHLASKSSWVCTQWSKSTYLKNKNKKQKKPPIPQNQTPYFTKQSCNWRRTGHPMNCCACWSSTYGVENVYRIGHNVGLFFNRSNLKMENMHLPKCSKRTRAFIKQLSKHSFDKKSSFLTAKYLLMPHLEISIVCCISYF